MTPATRRDVLAGLTTAVVFPAAATATTPREALGAALDAAASIDDPDEGLRRLAMFDADTLHGGERLDLTTARAGLTIDARLLRDFPFGRRGRAPYRVTAFTGAWKAATPDAAAIDAETDGVVADAEAGIVLPLGSLDRTIAGLRDARPTISGAAATAIERQIAMLDGYRDRSASPPGIGRLPGGVDWYALLLQRTLGPVRPDMAERRLIVERNRLHDRAQRLFDRIGLPAGSLTKRYARLWRDDRFLYPDSATDRGRLIDDMNRMVAQAGAHVAATFGTLPAWCLDVEARPLSDVEIAAGRGGYRVVPTPDRPGAYVVDLRDVSRRPRWTLPGVVAHELLPGHMIQLGLEGVQPPHPLRLDHAAAFVEGWAIHAEQLADAAGANADPHDALGHVHWLLFRVARALVDIGIHLHGWSIGQARQALVAWQGEPAYFAPFDLELARIPLEPATRVAEAMAWLTIADAARGQPPIAFHAALLADGRKRTDDIRRLTR